MNQFHNWGSAPGGGPCGLGGGAGLPVLDKKRRHHESPNSSVLFSRPPFHTKAYHSFVGEDSHLVVDMVNRNLVVVEVGEDGIHLVLDYHNHVGVVAADIHLDYIHRIVVDCKPFLLRRKKRMFILQGKQRWIKERKEFSEEKKKLPNKNQMYDVTQFR